MKKIFKWLANAWLLVSIASTPIIIIFYAKKLESKIENNRPVIYQADNAGGMTSIGVVTEKKDEDGRYSIAVNGYGWFLVTKEHYDMIQIGRKAPEFILERGN